MVRHNSTSRSRSTKRPAVAGSYHRLWSNRGAQRLPIAPESKGLGRCNCTAACEVGSCLNALMLMECGRSNCPFPTCNNRAFADAEAGRLDCLTEVFWTGNCKGFGLRSTRSLRRNQLVAEYVGEIITQKSIQNWRYIMSLPQGFAIDASMAGGPARFINHSCEPNCNAQRWLVEGRWHVGIFASRDILPREELTFSYSDGRGARGNGFGSSDPCHCGATACSGRIAEPPKNRRGGRRGQEKQSKEKSKDLGGSEAEGTEEPTQLAEASAFPAGHEAHPEVVEVDDDEEQRLPEITQIELPDATLIQQVADFDEEETLQDLLFQCQQPAMQTWKAPLGATKLEPDFGDLEQTALTWGLFLPSALSRARQICMKNSAA